MKYTLNVGRQSLASASISTDVKIRCQYDPATGDFNSETAAWGFLYDSPAANVGADRNPETAQDWADLLALAEACQEAEKENEALEAEWRERLDKKRRARTWEIIRLVEKDFPQVRVHGDLDPEIFVISPNTTCFSFDWDRRCRTYEDVERHLLEIVKFTTVSERICEHFGLTGPEHRGNVHLYKNWGVSKKYVAIFGRENRHHDFPQELLNA